VKKAIILLLVCSLLAGTIGVAAAAKIDSLNYPSKPITIVVPRGPGGGLDLLARMIVPMLTEELGQPIIVDNVEGGGGVIGLNKAYSQPADGYTLVSWSPPGEYMTSLQGNLGFPADKLTPLGAQNVDPGMIAVRSGSNIKTFDDLIKASRDAKEPLTCGVVGMGTTTSFAAILYQNLLGVKWTLVPHDDGNVLTAAIMGGHVDFGLRQGGWYDLHPKELNILAIASNSRIEELPDVPTIGEVTGTSIVYGSIRGLAIRADADPRIIDLLAKTYDKIVKSDKVKDEQFKQTGFKYGVLTRDELLEQQKFIYGKIDELKDQIFNY
jgi:tripartite-type tricarboxylate transporter receptor subunit TctC